MAFISIQKKFVRVLGNVRFLDAGIGIHSLEQIVRDAQHLVAPKHRDECGKSRYQKEIVDISRSLFVDGWVRLFPPC